MNDTRIKCGECKCEYCASTFEECPQCKKRNLETIAGGTTLGSIPQSIKFGGTSHGNFYYTPNVSDGMSWEYHTC